MGPPSSFFLAVVAIVILAFAILGFISAVNYKNVSNNTTEGESIDKGTAGSLSTVMIIFGLVMLIAFIWIVYVIFTYNNKEKSGIDPRDASLLAKATASIAKLDSVQNSYKALQANFNKFKDKTAEKNKDFEKWDYCPSPRIKININQATGEVLRPEYDGQGNLVGLIVKPKSEGPPDCKTYKKIDLTMETQPCYVLKENDDSSGPGGFFAGFKQKLGNMTQSMNPLYPTMPNVVNSSYQLTNPNTNSGDCNAKGFMSRKEISMPVVSFKAGCKNDSSNTRPSISDMYPGPLVNPNVPMPKINEMLNPAM